MEPVVRETEVEAGGDARDALEETGEFLAEDPVERNLAASLLSLAAEAGSPVRCWTGRVGDRVTALLLQTDPERFGLVFASSRAAATALGQGVADDAAELPAVRGEVGAAAAFAGAYATVTGRPGAAVDAHRLYVLGELRPPEVSGEMRAGVESDAALVADWAQGFVDDTGFGTAADVEMMMVHLRSDRIRLWIDAETPVAMGVASPVALGVSRIGGIYTTPDRRGAGYGAAVTAAISAEQLAGEASTCMLYTQLSNPVSNRLYQRLGYAPVHEDLAYRFGEPDLGSLTHTSGS